MRKGLVIWRLIDGKPGHENQSAGLVDALSRILDVECIDVPVIRPRPRSPRPDLIIGAGHATHWKLLWWSFCFRAKSVVLMKPSLPIRLFDLCLIPQHDLKEGLGERSNLVPTVGVLNRVHPGEKAKPPTGLILVGGASKEFNWDGETLRKAIGVIVRKDSSVSWLITDSRRTESGFLNSLSGNLMKFPHAETDRNWLPEHLATVSKCWVTEDSVSMIYEALSSGAQVGLLPMPRKGHPGRVVRGIQKLVDEGRVYRFGSGMPGALNSPSRTPLREADRCAELLVQRFGLLQERHA